MSLVDLISTGLHDIQATRYAQLASSAIIVFDHIITLDQEVDLIWKSSWSMGKILFIINRYYTLTSVIPTITDSVRLSVRLHFFRWQGWTGLIACMIAEVILQMRLYALYFLDRRVLALMVTMFIASSATSAAIMGTALSRISAVSSPLPGIITFCAPSGIPPWFYAFWIPILAFESLMCALALYRGFQTFRASEPAFQSGRHLVAILIRDSVLYFLVMFATYFTNMLIWVSAPMNLIEIPVAFSVALSCCLGNRMIFNVREVNREIKQSKAPSADTIRHSRQQGRGGVRSSFYTPAELTDIEMAELREMRVDESYGQFIVL
ncbi:hypothetical protein FB45DRAFT_924267 [Roridomyces roridus]|uniref:DUF6533 domain-containing protein n=1 Tax=Roridomyces roridus TaxID=1738132 RepID=A0AAD7BMI3_9AGAR|nr:hypothetical protein FB45DRAFT_924267 [Roridomyces roridus]